MRKLIPILFVVQLVLLTAVGISCKNQDGSEVQGGPASGSTAVYYVVENKSASTLTLSVLGQPVIIATGDSVAVPQGTVFFILNNKSYPYFLDSNITINDDFLSILIR